MNVIARQGYSAARAVAPLLHAHFTRHLDEARRRGVGALTPLPDVVAIETMVAAAFWASLRREEGYVPRISLTFVAPDGVSGPLLFERPLPLDPGVLARIAPAVERPGVHLGVWDRDGELMVWGLVLAVPPLGFVLEVAAPGLLVVKHHRGDGGKFVNVAVVEGDQIKIVNEQATSLPECPALLTSLLGFDSPASWIDSVNLLVQIAVSMRVHGRGGALLVVPAGTENWRESIVHPISYSIAPPFSDLAVLARRVPEPDDHPSWQAAIEHAVATLAGLTAVDGATLISSSYELLAFGAKIVRRKGSPQVEQVTVTEPVEGGVPSVVDPSQLGGTRHFSAAQFVQDHHDATALVASQDGRFTVFAWSPCEDMVHAHRVEILLV